MRLVWFHNKLTMKDTYTRLCRHDRKVIATMAQAGNTQQAGHLHLTEADDGFEVGGIEGGEDAFASDGFFGLGGIGFEEIERDAPHG